jgi:magnesium transporter
MDTYANIINNNMSTVMKTLTIISMFLMVPTLVASLFGMNLRNGMEASPVGFILAIILSIALTALFWWYAKRKAWL